MSEQPIFPNLTVGTPNGGYLSDPAAAPAQPGPPPPQAAPQPAPQPAAPQPAPGPRSDVAMDLDALEREGAELKPFVFTHNGRQYTLVDPQEMDWQDLLSGLRNPALFLRYALPPADHREFFAGRLPSWKMIALMEGYTKHYGLPDLGNASALPR